jgi:hypothetical protein
MYEQIRSILQLFSKVTEVSMEFTLMFQSRDALLHFSSPSVQFPRQLLSSPTHLHEWHKRSLGIGCTEYSSLLYGRCESSEYMMFSRGV